MTSLRWHLGFGALALFALGAGSAPGQERVLTGGTKVHFDASFSPNGSWLAYQAKGSLWVKPATGGTETLAHNAGQAVTYIWESNSASMVVFAGDLLLQVSRDGRTKRTLANVKGKGIQDFFFIANGWVYGVRRVGQKTYVIRVATSNGKLEDLITTVPGVTSLDVDRGSSKLLISAVVFLFTYNFLQADLDGKNLTVINPKAMTTPADHGRWLSGTTSLMLEHTGQVGTRGSGFQVWKMDAKTGNAEPLSWLPRQRKGVPALSPDGKWIATLEHRPGTGTARALIFPATGGGEAVLSAPLFQTGNRIRWAPNGNGVVYVGATDRTKKPDVRVYDFERLLSMSPLAQPGKRGTVVLPLARNEAGFVFLGFGVAAQGLKIPGLARSFDLDLTKGVMMLYNNTFKDVTGPWITPNSTSLIGLEVYLQAIRLKIGQGLKGEFLPVSHIAIAP